MKTTQKLYLVTLRGMSSTGSVDYSKTYVVARSSSEAYDTLRSYLDENDIGFRNDRELECVRLLAEESEHPECRTMLFVRPV